MHFAQLFRGIEKQLAEVEGKLGVFDKQIAELDQEIQKLSYDIDREDKGREGEDEQTASLRQKLFEMNKARQKLLEELAVLRGKLKAQSLSPVSAPEVNWTEIKRKLNSAYGRFQSLLKDMGVIKADPGGWEKKAKDVGRMFEEVLRDLDMEQKSSSVKQEREQDEKQQREAESRTEDLARQIEAVETQIKQRSEQEGERKKQLFVKERLLRNKQDTLLRTRDEKNTLSVEQAKLSTRKETYSEEAKMALGGGFAELVNSYAGSIPADLSDRMASLKKQLEQIGGVDELTMQEHKETEDRYEFLTEQLSDLEKGISDLRSAIKELDEVIKTEFNNAFKTISEKFSEYFRVLFGGGKATMFMVKQQIVDEEGEEEEAEDSGKENKEIVGIQINATPPGKKLAAINALSGGERALTAIAFLSALLAAHPSPFVVLDEVDAALDEANSIRFGKILAKLADRTQFITITHNRETMRQSHTLYGVTMGDDGVSHMLSLKLEEAAVYSTKN
jgi:chromosome segregation protein